jgi:hypothetical protein
MKRHVKLTKVNALEGRPNTKDVDYFVKGYIDNEPEIGAMFYVDRYERNGVEVPGVFKTSPVQKILREGPDSSAVLIHTENSVWYMEKL